MITIYFRPAGGILDPADAMLVTLEMYKRFWQVTLEAARERIPSPTVPHAGVFVERPHAKIAVIQNATNPNRFQSIFVLQALEGIFAYGAEQGWLRSVIEIRHDVLGYIGNVAYANGS